MRKLALDELQATESDSFIYHEMMAHPALFTHIHPHKVAIIGGGDNGILQETLKHQRISEIWLIENDPLTTQQNDDPRVKCYIGSAAEWITNVQAHYFDVIIINTPFPASESKFLHHCLAALSVDGVLVQQSTSPFQLPILKAIHENLHHVGFRDVQILHFPQPSFPTGWRMAWMATKRSVFRRVSEKDVYNKSFKTRYYNFDVHKAALALPEFIREELEITA